MAYTGTDKTQHLCVLVHGLWGNPIHCEPMAKALRKKHPEDKLHVLVAKRNSGSFTYDGIERGGERVCFEIGEEIEKLARDGQVVTKISVVGYSLGGLVARYTVGLLESRGFFENVKPVNFTTFASPHLGVRSPLNGWHNQVFNVLGARTLSASGTQLFTIDKFRETGKPLLDVMADPGSVFIKGLAKFERRTLYANIVNDRSAPYYTTGIAKTDPYTNLKNIKINYLDGYDDVIVNPEKSVEPLDVESSGLAFPSRFSRSALDTVRRLPFMLAAVIFVPIGLVVFLLNSGFQSLSSNRRIRLHERGLAGIQISNYRVPLLTDMRGAVEDAYENLNNAQDNDYLLDTDDNDEVPSSQRDPRPRSTSLLSERDDPEKSDPRKLNTPLLALAPCQFKMIQGLDAVGFRKYPVHIHKVNHSHAAIICRRDNEKYSEGQLVFRHWLDEEFII